ncbi:MAG: 2-C-methyl-D-erythritol 2,4-cyclodiphosphate synthase [Dehalococcoidia bacterium]
MRIGHGYDIHRLAQGDGQLVLGGIATAEGFRLQGHSDADVLLHAVCDALLGAAGLGDLGALFPADQERWKGAASADLLALVLAQVHAAGLRPANVDTTLIAWRPRLSGYQAAMRDSLAKLLSLDSHRVNVKLKTNEGFDATGRGQAIAAYAVVLVREESDE